MSVGGHVGVGGGVGAGSALAVVESDEPHAVNVVSAAKAAVMATSLERCMVRSVGALDVVTDGDGLVDVAEV